MIDLITPLRSFLIRAVKNRRTYRTVGQNIDQVRFKLLRVRPDVQSNFSVTLDRQNAFASQTCRCLQSPIFVYFCLQNIKLIWQKKIYVCLLSHVKKIQGWSVGIIIFLLLSAKPEIVVPGSGIRYFIFEISGKPSFIEAVL